MSVIRSRSEGVKGRDGLGASTPGTATRGGGGGADTRSAGCMGARAGAAGGGPGCKPVASRFDEGTLAR
ncbi:MAG TPA: hypothetical protein VJ860_06385, partial [Polyangia bacterium]|nr:hypothetical protein [Polyangia bacterium]